MYVHTYLSYHRKILFIDIILPFCVKLVTKTVYSVVSFKMRTHVVK